MKNVRHATGITWRFSTGGGLRFERVRFVMKGGVPFKE